MEVLIAGGVGEHGRNCFFRQGGAHLLSRRLRKAGRERAAVSEADAGADPVFAIRLSDTQPRRPYGRAAVASGAGLCRDDRCERRDVRPAAVFPSGYNAAPARSGRRRVFVCAGAGAATAQAASGMNLDWKGRRCCSPATIRKVPCSTSGSHPPRPGGACRGRLRLRRGPALPGGAALQSSDLPRGQAFFRETGFAAGAEIRQGIGASGAAAARGQRRRYTATRSFCTS